MQFIQVISTIALPSLNLNGSLYGVYEVGHFYNEVYPRLDKELRDSGYDGIEQAYKDEHINWFPLFNVLGGRA